MFGRLCVDPATGHSFATPRREAVRCPSYAFPPPDLALAEILRAGDGWGTLAVRRRSDLR